MKITPETTFLNRTVVAEPAAKSRMSSTSWKLILMTSGGLLLVLAYGFLLVQSSVEYFRPEFTSLSDGWVLLTNKTDRYSVELPSPGRKQTTNGQVTYYPDWRQQGVHYMITSNSVASQLLKSTDVKFLRDTMQADATQGSLKGSSSGQTPDGSQWIDYRVKSPQMAFRRRVLLRNKKIVTITVTAEEQNLETPEVDRIMNSARFLR